MAFLKKTGILAAVLIWLGLCAARADAVDPALFRAESAIAVYSISQEKKVRTCGEWADLSALGADEFYSFYLELTYAGQSTLPVERFSVIVDNGQAWSWQVSDLAPGAALSAHIYHDKMQSCMNAGLHTATWLIDDTPVHSAAFLLTSEPTTLTGVPAMDWNGVLDMPAPAQIQARSGEAARAPYVSGWLQAKDIGGFTQYAIDFRADRLAEDTYCCLGCWSIDMRSLEQRYARIEANAAHAYAGLQDTKDGNVSILSFWDVYATDADGTRTTIRAQRVHPEQSAGTDAFGGEGTGAHTIVPYAWEAGRWYRMLMACVESPATRNTQVEQWICDLETGAWTRLCCYDLGYSDACFTGNVAVFLENFDPGSAGDVRSMELRNARVLAQSGGTWCPLQQIFLQASGSMFTYRGSYAFGSSNQGVYMVTSGVGDWARDGRTNAVSGNGQPGMSCTLGSTGSAAPY